MHFGSDASFSEEGFISRTNADLANDLGINSLELADLILLCEEKFNISIDDEDLHKFVTVGDVVAYLEEKSA